jgi:hypothetical protein
MLFTTPYNREKAVEYAKKWANSRNLAYLNFDGMGGDCTNFASQSIYAGSGTMNYAPTLGWFYNSPSSRAPAWSGVQFLYNFLINNKKEGPFAKQVDISKILLGDIFQLGNESKFYHTGVIVSVSDAPTYADTLICAHTNDSSLRPLSSYSFNRIRFLHIEGVRKYTVK